MSQENQTTAIAKFQFAPVDPIGTKTNLAMMITAASKELAKVMPAHASADRLAKMMMIAVNKNPKLLECTQASISETIFRAAELGLDIGGALGDCYAVPFLNSIKVDNRERKVQQCQLMIGYRGMERLAWQSNEIASIDAEVVRAGDHFVFKKGTEIHVEWSPSHEKGREKRQIIGAYAAVVMKSGGKVARFLTYEEIEKIRLNAKSKDSPAWRNWYDEMARKSALKRTLKDVPLSVDRRLSRAIEIDNEDDDFAGTRVREVAKHEGGTSRVLDRVRTSQGEPPAPPQSEPQQDEDPFPGGFVEGEIVDYGDSDQQPPAETPPASQQTMDPRGKNVLTWDATIAECVIAAEKAQMPRENLDECISGWLRLKNVKRKGDEVKLTSVQDRLDLVRAIEEKRIDHEGKIA